MSDGDDEDRRIFMLDGELVDIREFIAVNLKTEAFDEVDVHAIEALPVGGKLVYGGGAAATFVLRRLR
jgi:hypothetical protein